MKENANKNDGEIMHDKEDKENKMILEKNDWKDVVTIPEGKGTKLRKAQIL
jgi:hypothetical protein